jgi:hypothetical protein
MLKRHYLTGVLALLSLAAGSAAASAAETGTKTMPESSIQAVAYRYPAHGQFNGYRGLYDHAGPPAGYGYTTTVTPGMSIDGIRIPGTPEMAIIEAA